MESEGHKIHQHRYLQKMDIITLTANPGTRERWKAAAEKSGLSMVKFIISAVELKISVDGIGDGLPPAPAPTRTNQKRRKKKKLEEDE